mmetsp:Transcript_99828/g.281839  ORF Transcript_99828/g.281839 Transcript_99828/m.281839 type:complete len:318 (-) Transcript_99828:211-1164(-)
MHMPSQAASPARSMHVPNQSALRHGLEVSDRLRPHDHPSLPSFSSHALLPPRRRPPPHPLPPRPARPPLRPRLRTETAAPLTPPRRRRWKSSPPRPRLQTRRRCRDAASWRRRDPRPSTSSRRAGRPCASRPPFSSPESHPSCSTCDPLERNRLVSRWSSGSDAVGLAVPACLQRGGYVPGGRRRRGTATAASWRCGCGRPPGPTAAASAIGQGRPCPWRRVEPRRRRRSLRVSPPCRRGKRPWRQRSHPPFVASARPCIWRRFCRRTRGAVSLQLRRRRPLPESLLVSSRPRPAERQPGDQAPSRDSVAPPTRAPK